MSNEKTEIEFSNLKLIIKTLKQLDTKYLSEFYSEAKNIAKPVQDAVIKAIPSAPPVRGMRAKSQRGRLAWGIGKRAKSVIIRANRTVQRKSAFAQGKMNTYPIVQVAAQSPGTVLADMAGKTNRYTNKKPQSRKHEINLFGRGEIVERTYKINNQGIALINALNNRFGGSSSRFFWPAALSALPEATRRMQTLVNAANEKINRMLGT
jgi:hypothetical protein